MRPAVLAGAICYTLGGSSIIIDLGRYWNSYWLALPGVYNLGSVLLEVAVCVIPYVSVLWIEVLAGGARGAAQSKSPRWSVGRDLAPAARQRDAVHHRARGGAPHHAPELAGRPDAHRRHQGAPALAHGAPPTLGLISCLRWATARWSCSPPSSASPGTRRLDTPLFADLSKVNGGLLFLFSVLRLGDIAVQGSSSTSSSPGDHVLFFFLEMALFLTPAFMFFSPRWEKNRGSSSRRRS